MCREWQAGEVLFSLGTVYPFYTFSSHSTIFRRVCFFVTQHISIKLLSLTIKIPLFHSVSKWPQTTPCEDTKTNKLESIKNVNQYDVSSINLWWTNLLSSSFFPLRTHQNWINKIIDLELKFWYNKAVVQFHDCYITLE